MQRAEPMSEKLLRFLLSELKTVRVICNGKVNGKSCGMIYEMSIESLSNHIDHCPVCHQKFIFPKPGIPNGTIHPLANLADAIEELERRRDGFEVQFVLPDND
jgi:hypothetical protein